MSISKENDPIGQNNNKAVKRKLERKQKRKNKHEQKKKDEIETPQEVSPAETEITPGAEAKTATEVKPEGSKDLPSLYANFIGAYVPATTVYFKESEWHVERPKLRNNIRTVLDFKVRKSLKELAKSIYERELELFKQYELNIRSREVKAHNDILANGTMKDQIATHILCISRSPVHSMHHLLKLTSYLASNKDAHLKGIHEDLCSVLSLSLLPRGVVAQEFEKQDFHGGLVGCVGTDRARAEKVLLLWYFEDQLRLGYAKLLTVLGEVLGGTTASTQQKAIRILLTLLENHPNQDSTTLLEILVNKLGSLERELPNLIVKGVKVVLNKRRPLKRTLVNCVWAFLNRKNQRKRSHYLALSLLKDILLEKNDPKLTEDLLVLYFGFYRACLKQGEVDTKLMSTILRGINRAVPYIVSAKGRHGIMFLEQQLETFYKMAHLVKFKVGVLVLQLLYKVTLIVNDELALSERYQRILYKFLASPELGSSRAKDEFLNLVFKAMNRMRHAPTLRAFASRLVITTGKTRPDVIIAGLFILDELRKSNPMMKAILEGKEVKEEITEVKDEEKVEEKPVEAVIDPLIHIHSKSAKNSVAKATDGEDTDSDGDEYFADLDVDEHGNAVVVEPKSEVKTETGQETTLVGRIRNPAASDDVDRRSVYDPYSQNPKFCGAGSDKFYALHRIANYWHPTVAIFAKALMSGEPIDYKGDPLVDFTAMKFLDKFTNRNPKKIMLNNEDGSLALGSRAQYLGVGLRSAAVSTKALTEADEKDVPPELRFLHRFYNKYSDKSKRGPKGKAFVQGDDDEDEVEAFLEKFDNKFRDDKEFDDEWENEARDQEEKKKDKKSKTQVVDDEQDDEEDDDMSEDDTSDGDEDMSEEEMSGEDDVPEMTSDAFDESEDEKITKKPKKKSQISSGFSSEEEMSGDDDLVEGSDSEGDDNDEDFDDDDDEDFEDDDEADFDDEDGEDAQPSSKKRKLMNMFKGRSTSAMLMDADAYQQTLEKHGSRRPATTSQDIVGAHDTHVKQLDWEQRRSQKQQKKPVGGWQKKKSFGGGKRKGKF